MIEVRYIEISRFHCISFKIFIRYFLRYFKGIFKIFILFIYLQGNF